jgi:hypothetical protein
VAVAAPDPLAARSQMSLTDLATGTVSEELLVVA